MNIDVRFRIEQLLQRRTRGDQPEVAAHQGLDRSEQPVNFNIGLPQHSSNSAKPDTITLNFGLAVQLKWQCRNLVGCNEHTDNFCQIGASDPEGGLASAATLSQCDQTLKACLQVLNFDG